MEDYQDRLVIATPEGIEVSLDLAGVGSRFTATLIDLILKTVVATAGVLLGTLLGGVAETIALVAIPLLVYLGYDILFEARAGGRTPGKRATGLRVLRADGGPEDLAAAVVRNLLRLVDGLPLLYVPGAISIMVTRRNQRLGDLAAGTIVVRERRGGRRAKEPGAERGFGAATAPEPAGVGATAGTGEAAAADAYDERPAAAAYDLGGLTQEDVAALRGFLDRRGDLAADARGDLARRLATALRPKVAGPFEGLGPEAFLEAVDAARRR